LPKEPHGAIVSGHMISRRAFVAGPASKVYGIGLLETTSLAQNAVNVESLK